MRLCRACGRYLVETDLGDFHSRGEGCRRHGEMSQYKDLKTMPSFGRIQLENWIKTIDVKADRVLDVGGSQKPVKGRTKSWHVGEYKILDLEKPHENAQRPDIVADIQTEKKSDFPMKPFDVVFCLEVAEYWHDPMTACRNLAKTVRRDGTLYISFPFIYPVHKPIPDDCLRYTLQGARKLLHLAGFNVENVTSKITKDPHVFTNAFISDGMRSADRSFDQQTGFMITARKV